MTMLSKAVAEIERMDADGEVVTIEALTQRIGCSDALASKAIAKRPDCRDGAPLWIPGHKFSASAAEEALDQGAGDVASDGYDLRMRTRKQVQWDMVTRDGDGFIVVGRWGYPRANAETRAFVIRHREWSIVANRLRAELA